MKMETFDSSLPSTSTCVDQGVMTVDLKTNVVEALIMNTTEISPSAELNKPNKDSMEEEPSRLSLAYERLTAIPKTIEQRFGDHVKYLDISHNQITKLDVLVHFKHLTSLIADHNLITEECVLPPLPNLELLWMNHCKISSLYPWVGKLKESCPNLQFLSLMGNPAAPSYFNGGTFYEYLQYRLFLIAQFPSLCHLDDRRVTEDQRTEAQRLYKRPLFERIKPSGLSHLMQSTITWSEVQSKINAWMGKEQGGRNLLI